MPASENGLSDDLWDGAVWNACPSAMVWAANLAVTTHSSRELLARRYYVRFQAEIHDGQAVRQARQAVGALIYVEIEVGTLAQLDEAIAAGAERILLDNMDDESLKEAANRCHTQTAHPHTVYCEASGGIGFDRLKRVVQTGVDGIALGYLTHSSRSLDIGLDFVA